MARAVIGCAGACPPALKGSDWDRFLPGVPFNPPCS
jgi:hypothetical protein